MIAASLSGMKAAALRLNVSAENISKAATENNTTEQVRSNSQKNENPAAIFSVQNPDSKIIKNFPNEFAVRGKGYFQVITQGGQIAFTKDGSFKINEDGHIVTTTGSMLVPPLTIPDNVIQSEINKTGVVTALDENQNKLKIGKITLVDFENEAGLKDIGDGLKVETANSGEKEMINVDGVNSAIIPANSERTSNNVSISSEMVNQIAAEKEFKINAEAVNVQNEMMGTIIDLKI